MLLTIIIFSLLGGLCSLIGGILLLANEKRAKNLAHYLTSFAAGALLSTAFVDLLPEALELGPEVNIFMWALAGILVFFLIERSIHWFHHHEDENESKTGVKPTVPLVIFGDAFHNFIDGIVIATTFMVDFRLGVVTTLAVAAHEIPQEIGDFSILLHLGVKRARVLMLNIYSSLATVAGALIAYFAGSRIEAILPGLLALTAGFFIYIALSDLVPEIHHGGTKKFAYLQTAMLFVGVFVIWGAVRLLEG